MPPSCLTPPVPGFLPGRCAHELLAGASCTTCVQACPRAAFTLGEHALELDTAACDGCGACVAACPREALALPCDSPPGVARQGGAVYLTATPGPPEDRALTGPSLRELGWAALLRLHVQGVRELVLAEPDGPWCEAGPEAEPPAWRRVDAVLESRGLRPLALRTEPARRWRAQAQAALQASGVAPQRRAFLRRLVGPVVEELGTAPEGPAPQVSLLASGEPAQALFPAVPLIDPERCEACDACVRICPEQALREGAQDGGPARYEVEPSRCTGCGLCVDLCEAQALRLERWSRAPQQVLLLQEARCPACGVDYHTLRPRADGRCAVCARVDHHRRLYQTLPD